MIKLYVWSERLGKSQHTCGTIYAHKLPRISSIRSTTGLIATKAESLCPRSNITSKQQTKQAVQRRRTLHQFQQRVPDQKGQNIIWLPTDFRSGASLFSKVSGNKPRHPNRNNGVLGNTRWTESNADNEKGFGGYSVLPNEKKTEP
jgi:hypothetical protein